jgi:hypothetical protein
MYQCLRAISYQSEGDDWTMSLLILEAIVGDTVPKYRGTYRDSPFYRDDLPEDHLVNQTILRMISGSEDATELHSIGFVLDCVRVLNQHEGYDRFEVIEMAEGTQKSLYDGIFIGYDLSTGHFSLLYSGLRFRSPVASPSEDRILSVIQPLQNLIQAYFQPKLNNNGLFEQFDEARFCLDCLMTLQSLRPGLFENEDVIFKVVKLWKVYVPKG